MTWQFELSEQQYAITHYLLSTAADLKRRRICELTFGE